MKQQVLILLHFHLSAHQFLSAEMQNVYDQTLQCIDDRGSRVGFLQMNFMERTVSSGEGLITSGPCWSVVMDVSPERIKWTYHFRGNSWLAYQGRMESVKGQTGIWRIVVMALSVKRSLHKHESLWIWSPECRKPGVADAPVIPAWRTWKSKDPWGFLSSLPDACVLPPQKIRILRAHFHITYLHHTMNQTLSKSRQTLSFYCPILSCNLELCLGPDLWKIQLLSCFSSPNPQHV